MNERILALDIGDARIGVAVSDFSGLIASPVEVIRSVGWGPDTRRILELCRQYDTTRVLSGLPLNMDGTEGFQAQKVRRFCQKLEEAGLQITFQDERLTTVTAEDALLEGGLSRAERKQRVDKVAAAIILQQYLDANRTPAPAGESKEEKTMEENENIVELLDENGGTVRFEHLATLDHEDRCYIVLSPADDDDSEEVDVVFMEIVTEDDGTESYAVVDDEDLEDALFNKFMVLLDELDEEEEEAGEETDGEA